MTDFQPTPAAQPTNENEKQIEKEKHQMLKLL